MVPSGVLSAPLAESPIWVGTAKPNTMGIDPPVLAPDSGQASRCSAVGGLGAVCGCGWPPTCDANVDEIPS